MASLPDGLRLTVDLRKLRERSVMIATPAYGGLAHVGYNLAVSDLKSMLAMQGISHSHLITYNDGLVPLARNRLAQAFLESRYTDLLFVDADIGFKPEDVLALLAFDKDMIGAAYSKKEIDWEAVKRIVKANPDVSTAELEIGAGIYTTAVVSENLVPFVPVRTPELAAGFTMISRRVFQKLAPSCARYKAKPMDRSCVKGEWITEFFPIGVINEDFVSEDYQFCRKCTTAGIEMFVCPWMTVNHYGTHKFPGNLHLAFQVRAQAEQKIELVTK